MKAQVYLRGHNPATTDAQPSYLRVNDVSQGSLDSPVEQLDHPPGG